MKQKNCAERGFNTLLEVIYHTYIYPFFCTLQMYIKPLTDVSADIFVRGIVSDSYARAHHFTVKHRVFVVFHEHRLYEYTYLSDIAP